MPRMTSSQYEMYLAKHMEAARKNEPPPSSDAAIVESTLHDQILSECRVRGWKAIHSRMDKRSTVGEGVCDFVIFADNGRVICCECKTRSGKLSMEQNVFIAWLAKLGHHVAVVRSFSEFQDLITLKPKE